MFNVRLKTQSSLIIFKIDFTPTSTSQAINTFTSEEVLKALVKGQNIKFYITYGSWKTVASIISFANSIGKPSTQVTTVFWLSGNNVSTKIDYYFWVSPGSRPTIRTN